MNPTTSPQAIEETRNFFQKVYGWMCAGLIVSGITAYVVATTPAFLDIIIGNSIVFYGIVIAEVLLVIGLASMMQRISASTAMLMFLLYCFMTGLTLSTIFLVYTTGSIQTVFFITAGTFGVMSLFGATTKSNLTGVGHFLIMGLFGLVISYVVNMFLHNSQFDFILSIVGVVIFTGLTAYDTQKIKEMNIIGNEGTDQDKKEAITGALILYLDFINLFLNLLRLFGRRRD